MLASATLEVRQVCKAMQALDNILLSYRGKGLCEISVCFVIDFSEKVKKVQKGIIYA